MKARTIMLLFTTKTQRMRLPHLCRLVPLWFTPNGPQRMSDSSNAVILSYALLRRACGGQARDRTL